MPPKPTRPTKEQPKVKRLSRKDRLTPDIYGIIRELESAIGHADEEGRKPFAASWGVYAFYDYDDEPIYVGQTYEGLTTRVRRHLTNQRSDAVAMRVLDPMEVASVEIWPFWEFQSIPKSSKRQKDKLRKKEAQAVLESAEFTVYKRLIALSKLGKLLNERVPKKANLITLPASFRFAIVPADIHQRLNHADERIARRASTIATLSQVIKERDVLGLRQTLVTQAERLQLLASRRYLQVMGATSPGEASRELERAGPEDEEAEG